MASEWGEPEKDMLTDLLEQLGIERHEPVLEPERSNEPLLRTFQWLGLTVILANGLLMYLGAVPVWAGVGGAFCGGAVAFAAEIARKVK